ncbi:hypothetical protein M422DRAFT_53425 [Sphaerobolus stellatus SS14]|uniref:Uncharacterized protein n=1 Tax=Sphaerobolus stellatus (strain SS14) TaxID=990650 RepID=A0A0C9TMX2_SPHS4|nr:hypothetical protein M422DRAFT_53425 [Sphaerobolus stellatus SS14]
MTPTTTISGDVTKIPSRASSPKTNPTINDPSNPTLPGMTGERNPASDLGSRSPASSMARHLTLDDQILDTYPTTSVKWRVKPPLYKGQSDIIIANSGSNHIFPSALRRKSVKEYPLWNERHNVLLTLAEITYDRSKVAAARPLSREIEYSFRDILSGLEDSLKLLKCHPRSCSLEEPFGYTADPVQYQSLLNKIQEAIEQRSHIIENLPIELPTIPTWLGGVDIPKIWNEQEAELFSICLREDVENFLIHLWILLDVWKGTYTSLSFLFLSLEDPPYSDNDTEGQIYTMQCHMVRKVLERRIQWDEDLQMATQSKNQSQEQQGKYSPSRASAEQHKAKIGEESPFAEIKQKQVESLAKRTRPSVSFSVPSGANLTSSDTLEEMFKDSTPCPSCRESIYIALQETPVLKGVRNQSRRASSFSNFFDNKERIPLTGISHFTGKIPPSLYNGNSSRTPDRRTFSSGGGGGYPGDSEDNGDDRWDRWPHQ